MQRKLVTWVFIIFVPVIIICTRLITVGMFNMTLKNETIRVQSVQSIIIKDFANNAEKLEYNKLKNLIRKYEQEYQKQGYNLNFLYYGQYMNNNPIEDPIKSMNNNKRSAMLYTKGATPQYIIAEPINHKLTMILTRDLSDLYIQRNSMYSYTLYITAIACIVIIVLSWLMSSKYVKPIKKLGIALKNIENGNMISDFKYNAKDEMGVLIKSFVSMQNVIFEREAELKNEALKKENLLNALSHEMRTPLCAILGNARILQNYNLEINDKQEVINIICQQANRLSDMESQLMVLIENENTEIKFKNIDLSKLLNDVIHALKSQSEGVNIELIDEQHNIRGDYNLIYILASNIISNAIHASVNNGTIIVEGFKNGFKVSDNGIGMDDEQAQHVFEPFYKVDKARTRKHGGAGLGLSICRKIADLHKGKLIVQSKLGVGTTVFYTQNDNMEQY